MNEETRRRLTNCLVLLGIYAVFNLVFVYFGLAWNQLFVGRLFRGESGYLLMEALALVPAMIAGAAAGSLIPVFVQTSRYRAWAVALGVLAALADLTNTGAVQHLSRSMLHGFIQAVVIIGAVLAGAWIAHRRRPAPEKRRLFSYGTLQKEGVQLATVGRRLHGHKDELPMYEQSLVPDGDTHHANVTFNGNAQSRVPGTLFEITDAELAIFDEFEAQFSYQRVIATLASGRKAWVYVHAG